MPKGCRIFAAALVVLCAAAAPGQDKPKPKGPSPYESLDPAILSAALLELRMGEVNDYLIDQLGRSGESIAVKRMRADALIRKATLQGTTLPDRRRLLNQAIAVLREVVSGTENTPDDMAQIKHLEYKLKLAATAGLVRVEPYALRLMYLRASEQDRLDVVRLTARAANLMIEVENEANDLLVEWRADLNKLVTVVPLLRQLHSRMLYQAAWVYLYRGLALPDGLDKRQFLAMAQTAAQKSRQRGLQPYRSRLVQGIAARALGKHADAAKHLSGLNVARVPNDVRIQAMFETARNLAEQGKAQEALQAVDEFSKAASKLVGKSEQLQIELHSAILRSHVYKVQADKETMSKKKKALLDKGFQALVAVIQKHGSRPEVRGTMFDIIARKYGSDVDPSNAGSVKRAHWMALLALSQQRLKQKTEGARGFTEAITMLKEVLKRPDPAATMMRPDAMWYLALAYHELKDNIKAGRMFARLAKEFPTHEHARDAAMNATATFDGVISQRVENKKAVTSAIRKEFIAALNVLLGNDQWVKQTDVASQYYDLGWQNEKLAMGAPADQKLKYQQKAVEAYKKVPQSNLKDYMAAQHQALTLEVEIMAPVKDVPLAVAEGLVSRLTAYSVRTKQEARKLIKPSDKDLKEAFLTWGSRAAFDVATVHYNHMDRQAKAIEMLKALPGLWPDTPVLEESSEFLIRKLVEEGKTPEASEEVEAFTKKHPKRGSQLIDLVIRKIRENIKRLGTDKRMVAKVEAYRKGYQHLAKLLYDNAAKDPNSTPKRMLELKQMYGDALAESGQAQQALELFLECKADEDKKIKAQRDQIDKKINDQIKGMEEKADKEGPRALHKEITKELNEIARAPATGEVRAIALKSGECFTGELTKTPDGYAVKIHIVEKVVTLTDKRKFTGEVTKTTTGYQVKTRDAVLTFLAGEVASIKEPQFKTRAQTFTAGQVELIVPQDDTQTIGLFKANFYLKKKLPPKSSGTATTTTQAATSPATQKNSPEINEAMNLVLDAYVKLMNAQRQARKNALEEDPANFWGLGKSYFALGQYFKALTYFRELSERLDPNKNRQEYWQAQLASCRCAMEGLRQIREKLKENPQKNVEKLRKNTESLEDLQGRMRELEKDDPNKGGLYEEYNLIKARLRALLADS